MNNIDSFNAYTAYIFGKLYGTFPVAVPLSDDLIVDELSLPDRGGESWVHEQRRIAQGTIIWLVDTGYLMRSGFAHETKKYVLAPKAFEALNVKLSSLEGKEPEEGEESLGVRFGELARSAGKDLAKESWKQASSQFVGAVLGHAVKAMASP